jgi:hypothetical protein
MTDEETREPTEAELEAQARWRERQEAYRRALQAWRVYPAATEEDPRAEARDRGGKLRGGRA